MWGGFGSRRRSARSVERLPSRSRGVEASRPCLYLACTSGSIVRTGIQALRRRGYGVEASRIGVQVQHRVQGSGSPDWAARLTVSHYSTFMNNLE